MKGISIVGYGNNRAKADFYPTPEYATNKLLEKEVFEGSNWECASGDGAIAKLIPNCLSSDIRDGSIVYGQGNTDFLKTFISVDNIITNPPYCLAQEFVEHALECANKKVAMLLKLVFLESVSRKSLFDRKLLRVIYVFRRRLKIYANGIIGKNSGLIAYAWFVWDKDYCGYPRIEWI